MEPWCRCRVEQLRNPPYLLSNRVRSLILNERVGSEFEDSEEDETKQASVPKDLTLGRGRRMVVGAVIWEAGNDDSYVYVVWRGNR